MNDSEKNHLETFTRTSDFGAQNPTLFPAAQLAGQLMATITAGTARLTTLAAQHASSTSSVRQGTSSRLAARLTLHADLETLHQTAKALAFEITGLKDKFHMPRRGDQNLLMTARAFLIDATPLKNDFIRYGLPADFLDKLSTDIAAFEQAITAQHRSREQKSASNAGFDEVMESNLKALKQLDVILRNTLRDNVTLLTAWTTASRIERVPRRRKPKTPDSPTPSTKTGA